jgi:hypothetical protein
MVFAQPGLNNLVNNGMDMCVFKSTGIKSVKFAVAIQGSRNFVMAD